MSMLEDDDPATAGDSTQAEGRGTLLLRFVVLVLFSSACEECHKLSLRKICVVFL